MYEHLGKASGTSSTDFTPHTLTEIDDAGPDDETPAKVSDAVFGGVEREGRDQVWLNRVPDEATGGMGIEAEHEEECQVVGIPEHLKALLSNPGMGSGIHDEHDEEHEVAGDSTRLSIVYLKSSLLSNF